MDLDDNIGTQPDPAVTSPYFAQSFVDERHLERKRARLPSSSTDAAPEVALSPEPSATATDLALPRSSGSFKQSLWFVVTRYTYAAAYGDGYGDGSESVQRNDEFEKPFDCLQIIYDIGYEEGMRSRPTNKKLGLSLPLATGVSATDPAPFLGSDAFENSRWFEPLKIAYENGHDDGLRSRPQDKIFKPSPSSNSSGDGIFKLMYDQGFESGSKWRHKSQALEKSSDSASFGATDEIERRECLRSIPPGASAVQRTAARDKRLELTRRDNPSQTSADAMSPSDLEASEQLVALSIGWTGSLKSPVLVTDLESKGQQGPATLASCAEGQQGSLRSMKVVDVLNGPLASSECLRNRDHDRVPEDGHTAKRRCT
jgi:hypothetical protein